MISIDRSPQPNKGHSASRRKKYFHNHKLYIHGIHQLSDPISFHRGSIEHWFVHSTDSSSLYHIQFIAEHRILCTCCCWDTKSQQHSYTRHHSWACQRSILFLYFQLLLNEDVQRSSMFNVSRWVLHSQLNVSCHSCEMFCKSVYSSPYISKLQFFSQQSTVWTPKVTAHPSTSQHPRQPQYPQSAWEILHTPVFYFIFVKSQVLLNMQYYFNQTFDSS